MCGFDLDNVSVIPFRQSIEFCLRNLYMKEYCRISYQGILSDASVLRQRTEETLVSVWLVAMEKINNGESHFTHEQIVEEKQRMMLQSCYIPHCCLVIGEAYPDHRVFMSIEDEEDLIHILNDNVVVHHCHYSGTVYGPVHQMCNSKVQVPVKHLKINIYAHNATFDNPFVLKGINLSMLAQKGEIMPTLLGDNSE